MRFPFVRFSQIVRTPLSIATVGLCVIQGCQHVPGSRGEFQESAPAAVNDFNNGRAPAVYEESSLANPINSDASERPLVSLSEDEFFQLAPTEKRDSDASIPDLANQSTSKPVPTVELPKIVESNNLEEVAQPSAEPATRTRELPETTFESSRRKSPAPSPTEFEDEVSSEVPNSPPKLDVPPEPAQPATEDASKLSDPQAQSKNQSGTTDLVTLNDEVLSLDSYCDGLVFDSQGFGYLSHRDRIVKFSPTGETFLWATLSRPKGHRIEPEGTHLVCDTDRRAILRLSFDGKVIAVAAKDCDGASLRAPYDIAIDPNGGFYFTDPGFVQSESPSGNLHYVDRSGQTSIVDSQIGYPTGIAFDSKRQRVLVAESLSNRILEFRISEPGRFESRNVLVQLPQPQDGEFQLANLCLDAEGNLFVTQQQTKCVHVFDLQGRQVGRFSTNEIVPTSVAMRTPKSAELFLTGELDIEARRGKVFRLNLGN